MLRKLLRRRKNRLRRRTTFLRLFLPGMILPVLLTAVLGAYLVVFIRFDVYEYGTNQMEKIISQYMRRQNNTDLSKKFMDSTMLCLYSALDYQSGHAFLDPELWVEPEADSVVFTFDRDGNILQSNRAQMMLTIRINEEPDSEVYIYDPQEFDIPVLNELIANALTDYKTDETAHEYDITSLYLNAETHRMVPHIINVKTFTVNNGFMNIPYDMYDRQPTDSYQVIVDVPELPEDYVLTEIASRYADDGSFPRGSIQDVFGCEPEVFDAVAAEYKDKVTELLAGNNSASLFSDYRWEENIDAHIEKLYINTEEAGIFTYIKANTEGLHVWRRLIFVLGVLFGFMTLFDLTVCLIRNARNQAQYAFEDYQRALTNNLAHDLKTPLAVIGGYAENLIQMRQNCGEEKELEYLRSIMKNVAYTDDIIRKTLLLNETGQMRKLQKTETDLRKLADGLADKYRTALTEHGISLTAKGGGTVSADADLLTAAVENLISNAVKYTPDHGRIQITISEKQLCITNNVTEDLDTKNLTMPFVKGDKARSDKHSSGLGLSIAKTAAEQNGFSLKLECRDKQFTALLRF